VSDAPAIGTSALADVTVHAVTGFEHVTRRRKLIGRNAKRDVHGWTATEPVIRIETDQGLVGTGFGRVAPEGARAILGWRLSDLWRADFGAVGPLGRADHAIFDLVGQALAVPAWRLMGAAGPPWVPVYDTSFYFADLLPEHAERGVGRLIDEMEASLAEGNRAFKVKVGRGARWMAPDEGLARDIEVVRAMRRHGGPGVRLMADANDQWDLSTTTRFLDAVGEHLTFIEEPFAETEADGLALKRWMAERGLATRLADGESEHQPAALERLARAGALDVLQPDIRALGLSLQWRLARAVQGLAGVSIASHNWGSYLGTYKMLQLGRGIGNFMIAELDRSESDLFDDADWPLKEGCMRPPDTPGCGLRVREDVFAAKYAPRAWRVAL
jgi:D-galactarolactone cycloisomerase